MAVIPLETYKSWAENINKLNRRFASLIPWVNLFPDPQRRWWKKLLTNRTFPPFLDVKNCLDSLACRQHPLGLVGGIFDYPDLHYSDSFTEYWNTKATEICKNRKRKYPRPDLTPDEREMLESELFGQMKSLLVEIRLTLQDSILPTKDTLDKIDELDKRIKLSETLLESPHKYIKL